MLKKKAWTLAMELNGMRFVVFTDGYNHSEEKKMPNMPSGVTDMLFGVSIVASFIKGLATQKILRR